MFLFFLTRTSKKVKTIVDDLNFNIFGPEFDPFWANFGVFTRNSCQPGFWGVYEFEKQNSRSATPPPLLMRNGQFPVIWD